MGRHFYLFTRYINGSSTIGSFSVAMCDFTGSFKSSTGLLTNARCRALTGILGCRQGVLSANATPCYTEERSPHFLEVLIGESWKINDVYLCINGGFSSKPCLITRG